MCGHVRMHQREKPLKKNKFILSEFEKADISVCPETIKYVFGTNVAFLKSIFRILR